MALPNTMPEGRATSMAGERRRSREGGPRGHVASPATNRLVVGNFLALFVTD